MQQAAGAQVSMVNSGSGPPNRRRSADRSRVNRRCTRVRDVLPTVIESAPTAIAVFRSDRTVAYRNEAWVDLMGSESDERGACDVLAGALAVDSQQTTQEYGAHRQDGTVVQVLLTAVPLTDDQGRIIGVSAYAQPMGRGETGAMRDAFLGVLSHELRTPITSIYGGSQLLLNDRLSAGSRGEVLTAIAAEAEQLHRRIEDFLAVVRVDGGQSRPEREPLLLQRLVATAVAAERRRSPSQRFRVRAPRDIPPAVGDATQINQVLRNLISNAVDATPPGALVAIEIRSGPKHAQVIIRDRGPGIATDAGSDVFNLFVDHPAVGGHVPRSGIGLYVARTLVVSNGGRIWVARRRGGGTEVGFALPLFDLTHDD